MCVDEIFNSIRNGELINKEQAIELLNIKNNSTDFYKLISLANGMTRTEFNNRGLIFAQI